jgi:hypothetical protein
MILGTNVRIREVRSEYLNIRRSLMLVGSQQGFKPSTRQEGVGLLSRNASGVELHRELRTKGSVV